MLKNEEQKVLRWRTKHFVFGALSIFTGKSQTPHMPEPLATIKILMSTILILKKYQFEVGISKESFNDTFLTHLTNKQSTIGKYLSGKIENNSFQIRVRKRPFDFNVDSSRMFADFFELVGYYEQINKKLELNLKLRIKPLLQLYWLIGLVIIAAIVFPFRSIFDLIILLIVPLIIYVFLKVGMLITEPYFIDPFKKLLNIEVDLKDELGISVENQNKIKVLRTKKGKRILNNIGLPFIGVLFLAAIYTDTEISQFIIFIPLFLFIIIAFHQYYIKYKLQQLKKSNEILDFWLFYKMAKIPIPSFVFKSQNLDTDNLKKLRKKYNKLTGLIYVCLITSLILTLLEFKIF